MLKRMICFSFSLILCASSCYAQEPQNLDSFKRILTNYHDTGSYMKDIAAVISKAESYLKKRTATPSTKPLAMVLDIDETSLSNYKDMLYLNFGGTIKEIDLAEGKGTDDPISPTLKLYQLAKSNKIAVFFVTGRREIYRDATTKNLAAAGYQNWDELILKPNDYNNKSAAPFKIAARKAIEAKGYDIILNIGDQSSDLIGGYADKTFKLPNPYYHIP